MGDHDPGSTGLQPPEPTAISGGTTASVPPAEHVPEHEAKDGTWQKIKHALRIKR